MHRILRKIKFLLTKYLIDIYCLIFTNKKNKSIAIVSCDEWKNKVLEDIKLKFYLAKINIKSDIISWEQKNDYSKYDAIIIRSVWGFEQDKFKKWLDGVTTKVINDLELINNTFSKKNQFDILDKHNINHIPTEYVKSDKNLVKNVKKILKESYSECNKIVIKPDISESGNNTYVLTELENIKNSIKINELSSKFNESNTLLMIQPYIDEIKEGEISVIVFNNEISHVVVRYPGIFENTNKVEAINISQLPKDLLQIINNVIDIKEFKQHTYMRIDFVKSNNKYLVLEIELIDPILFINSIKNKEERKIIYENFANKIGKKLKRS